MMIFLTTATENVPHINPILRFLIYFFLAVPMSVCIFTILIKVITLFLLPLKTCFKISLFLGGIVALFLLIITIGIELTWSWIILNYEKNVTWHVMFDIIKITILTNVMVVIFLNTKYILIYTGIYKYINI